MSGVRETRKQQTKEAILTAAMAFFQRKGYRQTSLKELAEQVGIGKSTLYTYFRNKSELFLAFCEDEYARKNQEYLACLQGNDPLVTKLHRFFMAKFDNICASGDAGRMLIREVFFPGDHALRTGVQQLDNRYIDLLIPYFRAAQKKKELRQDVDLPLVIGQFYGSYLITLSSWYTTRLQTREDVSRVLLNFFEMAMIGLISSVEQPREVDKDEAQV
ncbi:MAG: hypothetical protein CSA34_02055 [Desulfobulbus propionicus]|nr:MAG: hypothetical protein CSA34_02055 [Desulfobulbus propionicus]